MADSKQFTSLSQDDEDRETGEESGRKRMRKEEVQTEEQKSNEKRLKSGSSDSKLRVDDEASKARKTIIPSMFRTGSLNQFKFKWLESIQGSCSHGISGELNPNQKIAAFDIDGTLIQVKSGKKFPANSEDWKLWNDSIPKKLQQLFKTNYSILFLSNQNFKNSKSIKDFNSKLFSLANVFQVPFQVFAAREKDRFRKPLTGMWDEFVKNHNGGIKPDKSLCFFVGDAAGRPAKGNSKKDWNDTDRKLALNLGIKFFEEITSTPEEFFNDEPIRDDFKLSGFDPTKYDHNRVIWYPNSTPLALGPVIDSSCNIEQESSIKHEICEIVLFVGPPSVGKTTCFERYFKPHGYLHINQDRLKTYEKCIKEVRKSIELKRSCVIDNTNPTKQIRSKYIEISKQLKCSIRCIEFKSTIGLCKHNNIYRSLINKSDQQTNTTTNSDSSTNHNINNNDRHHQSRELLPDVAFHSYFNRFEEPELNEGFNEIKYFEFVFHDDDDDDNNLSLKQKWNQFLF